MTAILTPTIVFKDWDANGWPLAFGSVATFIAGSSTPQATYVDSTQTTQNLNPLTLNNRGEANIWLDPTKVYKFQILDQAGNQIRIVDQVQGSLTAAALATVLTQAYIGAILYPQTAAELAAGVVPVNYAYPVGNVKRYGATGLGVVDDTTAINLALKYANFLSYSWFNPGPPLDYLFVAAATIFFPAGDYIYTGTAGAGFSATTLGVNLQGEGINVTRIRLGAGVVLLTGFNAQFASIKGITTYGGSGLYNLVPGSVIASITTNVMNVTALGALTAGLGPGWSVVGAGVTVGCSIVSQASGTPGGIGFYNVTTTANVGSETITILAANVEGQFEFSDINAFGYTGCYIGHCLNNAPDWSFTNMILHGALTVGNERQSFGIVVGGLCDGTVFDNIDFQENLVNIKMAPTYAQGGVPHTYVKRCQFYNWTLSPTNLQTYHIWLVPDTQAPSVNNNGIGIRINENKFGNENVITTDFRVIVADENTAANTNRLNYLPKQTASTGYIGGMQLNDNSVYGSATGPAVPSRAFVYSFTPNLWQLEFDNKFAGAFLPSLDYFAGVLTNRASQNVVNRIRHIHISDVGTTSAPVEPVTTNAGWFQDEQSIYQGFQSVRSFYMSGFDPGYTDLSPASFVTSWGVGGGASAQITDSVGGNEAVEVTLTSDGGIFTTLSATPTQSRVGFVSLDLKRSTTNPLNRVRVLLQDGGGTFVSMSRTINLLSFWRRVTIPFVIPGNDATITSIQVVDFGGDYNTFPAAGAARFQVGRVRVFHSVEAPHPLTRTLDSGRVSWTPGLIANGAQTSITVPIAGAAFGDICTVSYGAALNGLLLYASVSAAGSSVATLQNNTGAGITPTANAVRVRILKEL